MKKTQKYLISYCYKKFYENSVNLAFTLWYRVLLIFWMNLKGVPLLFFEIQKVLENTAGKIFVFFEKNENLKITWWYLRNIFRIFVKKLWNLENVGVSLEYYLKMCDYIPDCSAICFASGNNPVHSDFLWPQKLQYVVV